MLRTSGWWFDSIKGCHYSCKKKTLRPEPHRAACQLRNSRVRVPRRGMNLTRRVRVDEGLISRIRSFEYFLRNQTIHCRLGARELRRPDETVRFRTKEVYVRFDS